MVGGYSSADENWRRSHNYNPRGGDFFLHRAHTYQQTSRKTYTQVPYSTVPYFGPWPDRRNINPLTIPLAPMWAWDQSGDAGWIVSESLAEISQFDQSKAYGSESAIDDGQHKIRSPVGNQRLPNRRKDKKSLRKRPDEAMSPNQKESGELLRDDEDNYGQQHYGEGDLDAKTIHQEQDTKTSANGKLSKGNELTANKVTANAFSPEILISHESEREII